MKRNEVGCVPKYGLDNVSSPKYKSQTLGLGTHSFGAHFREKPWQARALYALSSLVALGVRLCSVPSLELGQSYYIDLTP